MNDWTLRLTIDVPEPRIERDRLVWSADGTNWDDNALTDAFIDPVTKTVMLVPLPETFEWDTLSTGAYARLRKTDYALIASNWVENPRQNAGDWYLESNSGEIVTTSVVYPANQPMYVAPYVYQSKAGNAPYLLCGWGSPTTGVSVRFSGKGDAAVFKGGVKVGTYNAGTGENIKTRRRGGAVGEEDVIYLLIPCRGRDLLVLSSTGGGFVHTFTDLPLTGDMATVTPPAAFWWQVPAPLKASVSCAPLRFKTSGVVRSKPLPVRYPPEFGALFETRIGFHAGATTGGVVTLVDAVTDAGFLANGVNASPVRVKVTLNGDGTRTPFVYSADFTKIRTTTTTANVPFDLTPFARSLSLTVPETGAATLSFSAGSAALAAAGLDRPTRIGDRPVRLAAVKGQVFVDIFRGTAAKPSVAYGRIEAARVATWECTDRAAQFALYSFRDTLPYDGFSLSNSVIALVGTAGFALSDADVTPDTFTLPGNAPAASQGTWNLLPQRGDTVQTWLDKLRSDFAGTWITGWSPTAAGYKYRFRRPDSFPVTPVMVLYTNRAAALAAGVPASAVTYRVVRSLSRTGAAAEANQILVVGQDKQTAQYVTAQYDDAASQNPALAPAARPENWRGQLVTYQLIDPLIENVATANRARDILATRLTASPSRWEVAADFLIRGDVGFVGVPVWKGDVLRVIAPATGVAWVDVRVVSLSMSSVIDTPNAVVRQATYQCEQIAEVLA